MSTTTTEPTHIAGSLESIFAGIKPPTPTGACGVCGVDVYRGEKRCLECEDRAQRRRAARLHAVRIAEGEIPASFTFTRAGLDDATVRARVRDAAALERIKAGLGGGEWLILLRGAAGLGKSVCAAAVAWSRAEAGIAPVWVDAFDLANAVARSPLGKEPQLVAEALAAPMLVLDDLGAETTIATSPIAEVLHKRHARSAWTAVTTWCDNATIRDRYGDGIARRLLEPTRSLVVDFKAKVSR